MQCVIICAGKGTRMRPLTEHTPKPLLEVCGKPILQHVVEALPEEIDELVLVVGYLQEQIRSYCGDEYFNRKSNVRGAGKFLRRHRCSLTMCARRTTGEVSVYVR